MTLGATSRFAGFSPDAIQFLADLAENNDRAWFQPRKAEFERLLKDPMEALVAGLADALSARQVPMLADAKRAPFRIYRDTRFSKDKSPYKSHLGASFPWIEDTPGTEAGGGHDERSHGNGGYFHFQPGEMYIGGGMWQMEKPRLEPIGEHRDHGLERLLEQPLVFGLARLEPGAVVVQGQVGEELDGRRREAGEGRCGKRHCEVLRSARVYAAAGAISRSRGGP